MNIKRFRKEFSGAPIDLFEMAETVELQLADGVKRVGSEQEKLVDAAESLLRAKQQFEEQLQANEIELG